MATFKISQLPAVTSIAGTEELEVNQASTSKKATASQLRAGLATSGAVTGSGLTMTADRLLGRTTASTGAIEEISIGSGLTLSAGTLAASGGGGGVTSFSTGTTGLTPSTSTTGSVTLGGTLAVANGGTGATTTSGAINALLPVQTSNAGKFLSTDGTNVSWTAGGGGSSQPVGTLQYFSSTFDGSYPGADWLIPDGSVVTQSAYPELFSRVGYLNAPVFTNRTSGTTSEIRALTYGNALYVYAGAGGVLATSTDAITWTARTSGTGFTINALAYGNALYVYAGAGGALRTSTDGITWTERTSGTTSAINALTYGNSLYVYAGAGGVLRTSTDAITWTARTSGTTSTINALTYGNALYVYAGAGGVLATSTDAITWTARTIIDTTSTFNALIYGNSLYVVAGNASGGSTPTPNPIFTSTDAITWTVRTSGTATSINALAYGNNLYLYGGAIGAPFGTSTDGITWTPRTAGSNSVALVYGNNLYVRAAQAGTVGTSTDATTVQSGTGYDITTEFRLPIVTTASREITGNTSNPSISGRQLLYIKAQ